MTDANTISALKEIIASVSPRKTAPASGVDLFAEGILDSFATIEMVGAVESKFGIALPVEELTMENFQTLESIAQLIARHRAA